MPMNDKSKQTTSSPQGEGEKKTGFFKKAETKIWKVMEPIGKASNKLAGKMGAESFWPTELADGEIEKAARILRTFTIGAAAAEVDNNPQLAETSDGVNASQTKTEADSNQQSRDKYQHKKTQKVIKKIPQKALQNACGVAIFTCFRTGFHWSGAGGSGVVLARLPDGSWGPPSGILIHSLGIGLVIGLDIYDVVLILRKPQALQAFTRPKVSLGGELSFAAGPVGNGAVLDSGIEAAPSWSYTKSKGAYAGVQLDGTIILKRDDANARFYGSNASVQDILEGKVIAPKAVLPLIQTLYAAEGRPEIMGTNMIPQGVAPGDTEISPEEAKAMEAYGHDEKAGRSDLQQPPPSELEPPPFSQQSTASGSYTMPPTANSSVHRVPPSLPPAYDAAPTSEYPPEKTGNI